MESGFLDAFSVIALVALIYKVIDFLKNLVNIKLIASKNGVVTQLTVWVAAVLVLVLASQAEISNTVVVLGRPLADFDLASLIVLALSFGSSASVFNDYLAAKDNNRSSEDPAMLPSLNFESDPRPKE